MENKTDTRKKARSRDVAAFVFFLFFSFGMWYIDYLGKELESELKTPLVFVNSPTGKIVAPEYEYLNVLLKGTGYTILKHKYRIKDDSVSIDLSEIAYRKLRASSGYYLLTSALVKPYELQLKSGCRVVAMNPDTLYFVFKETE
ncbi:MAG: hypothetical protein LBV26_09500 [Bacteroidales bacterium]|jgi:hypothetical protein|nr:hypothetical protein [Bacteroidales bacterium]